MSACPVIDVYCGFNCQGGIRRALSKNIPLVFDGTELIARLTAISMVATGLLDVVTRKYSLKTCELANHEQFYDSYTMIIWTCVMLFVMILFRCMEDEYFPLMKMFTLFCYVVGTVVAAMYSKIFFIDDICPDGYVVTDYGRHAVFAIQNTRIIKAPMPEQNECVSRLQQHCAAQYLRTELTTLVAFCYLSFFMFLVLIVGYFYQICTCQMEGQRKPYPDEGGPAARDSAARDSAARDSAARDSAARDSTARDSVARDSTVRDSAAQDSTARDSAARDSTARDSAARDSAARGPSAEQKPPAAPSASAASGPSEKRPVLNAQHQSPSGSYLSNTLLSQCELVMTSWGSLASCQTAVLPPAMRDIENGSVLLNQETEKCPICGFPISLYAQSRGSSATSPGVPTNPFAPLGRQTYRQSQQISDLPSSCPRCHVTFIYE